MNFTNKLCLCIAMFVSITSFGMVIRDENGFRIFDGQNEQVIQPYFVDPLLKRMSPEQLTKFVAQGNRIRAIRLSDGEHRLQAVVPGLGGGVGGAAFGVALGHGLVWGGAHLVAAVAGMVGTPVAGAAVEGGIAAASPAIEALAVKASLGLGTFFAVLTGPV